MKKNNYQQFFQIKNIVILFLLTMFFVVDRYLKFVSLNLENDFSLIKNIFTFTFYANKNISFSLPFSGFWLLIVVSLLLILISYYCFVVFKKKQWPEFFAWLAIVLGAFSNIIDRFKYSYVVDYLDVAYFTVLNLADVMISLGCFYIIFSNFISHKIKK
jgi:signal peptidase II